MSANENSLENLIVTRIAELLARTGGEITDLRQTVIEQAERGLLRATLEYTEGHVVRASKLLGLDRNTYARKARAYGLLQETTRGPKPRGTASKK